VHSKLMVVCPLCRTTVEVPGSIQQTSNKCASPNCAYAKHSLPVPSHFTSEEANYCCAICHQQQGRCHGGHCERIRPVVDEQTMNDEAIAFKEIEEVDEDDVAYWVKLFTPLLKARERQEVVAAKLSALSITVDKPFRVQMAKRLLKNVAFNIHECEALELIRKYNFSMLSVYVQECSREELVEVFSMSEVLGLGIEQYQTLLLSYKSPTSSSRSADNEGRMFARSQGFFVEGMPYEHRHDPGDYYYDDGHY
jgi:hypothetical protein